MLSICRLVPVDHGRGELQQMERYREIDFPIAGPSQATDQQKEILDRALKDVSLEDHDSSSGAQIVLVSPSGRIVAVENVEQHGRPDGFTWSGFLPAVRQRFLEPPPLEEFADLSTFICEEQSPWDSRVSRHCFEVIDSLGRSWSVYQVRAEQMHQFKLQDMGGVQTCRREDLADRLSRE